MKSPSPFLFLALAALLITSAPHLPAQTVADAAKSDDTLVVELSPFTVTADQENGYLAGNAISGTRTNKALRDLPISISVITSEILEDLNTVLPSEALLYTASVDFTSGGTTSDVQGSGFTTGTTTVRGSGTFFSMRDGFRTYGETAGVGVQRIEVVRGPSAVLYGITKPGGIVNYITKRPEFGKSFGRASVSYGSYESTRSTFDVNFGRMLDDRLAFRLSASYNDRATWFSSSKSTEISMLPSVAYKPFEGTELSFQYEYTERVFAANSSSYYTRSVSGYRGSAVPYFIYPEDASDPVAKLSPQLPAGLTPDFVMRGYGDNTHVPYKTGVLVLNQKVGEDLVVNAQFSRSRRNNWRQSFNTTAQFTGSLNDSNAGGPVVAAPRIRRQYENRDAQNDIDNLNLTAIYERTVSLPVVGKVENNFILGYTSMVENYQDWRVRQFNGTSNSRISYYMPFSAAADTGLPANFPTSDQTYNLSATDPLIIPDVAGQFRRDPSQDAAEENKFETVYVAWSGNMLDNRFLLNAGLVHATASQHRVAGAADTVTDADYKQNSPLFGAIIRPVSWISAYAQAAKSFNPNTSARDGFGTPLPAETGEGYEFGLKLDPWAGRLSANIAFFHTVEGNRFVTDPNAPNSDSFYIDGNGQPQPISGPNDPRYDPFLPGQNRGAGAAVGEATTEGVDFEVVWSPATQFQLFATYSYLDGYVSRDENTTLATFEGRPLPNNYDHRFTVLAKYRFTTGVLKGLDVMLGANWRSEIFRNIINETDNSTSAIISPVERYGPAVWDGDFKLGYSTKLFNRKTKFQFNVKNLFDRTVATGWKPTTERTYSFEQYTYKVPASYTFSMSFDL